MGIWQCGVPVGLWMDVDEERKMVRVLGVRWR